MTARDQVRKLAAPVLDLVDRRLDHLNRRLDRLGDALSSWASRSAETEELLGRNLNETSATLDQLVGVTDELTKRQNDAAEQIGSLREQIGWIAGDLRRALDGVASQTADGPAELAHLDEPTAFYLNKATGYRGLAAQAGVFVNEPIIVHYGPGEAKVTDINERIVELPFVFRALAGLPHGAKVMDVGSSESTVALSLASLGFEVTAVDPRGYAFGHPSLSTLGDVADAEPGTYDAAVVLSTIEHVGVEHYGQAGSPDADLTLMSTLATKMAPGGRLVLTTPYGDGRDGGFQRIYAPDRLRKLLDDWDVTQVEMAQRSGQTEWQVTPSDWSDLPVVRDDEYRVVMLVATAKG